MHRKLTAVNRNESNKREKKSNNTQKIVEQRGPMNARQPRVWRTKMVASKISGAAASSICDSNNGLREREVKVVGTMDAGGSSRAPKRDLGKRGC